MTDIKKAAGVIVVDRKLLVARSKNKHVFVAPGGKVEVGEDDSHALIRELKEEFNIEVDEQRLTDLGTFVAQAAGNESKSVSMHVFIVSAWQGAITACSEIEEIKWVNSNIPKDIQLGSIFQHEVIPMLKDMDLID